MSFSLGSRIVRNRTSHSMRNSSRGIYFSRRITLLALVLLCIFPAAGQTPITLYNNFTGNLNYTVIGGTLRSQPNPNSCTVNASSSYALALPSGSTVVAAYLYWAGSYSTTPDYRVRLNGTVINASRTFTASYNNGGTLLPFFSGFADVTTQVAATGNATYTFDSLTVNTGDPHCSVEAVVSGWGMVVVYQRTGEIRRSINIWDGFQYFRGSSITFNPNNFYIPYGSVDGKLTHITWEGDAENSAALNGFTENLYFNGNVLSDAINPVNNQFNSASSGLTPTATPGVDIDVYNVSSYLHGGDTSATSTYSTGGDLVLLSCEVISTSDTSSADVQITKTHSGGASIVTGNNTTFTLAVTNNGPDTAGTITVVDTLPTGANYVSFSGTGWTIDSTAKPRYVFRHTGSHVPGVALPAINVVASLNQAGYPKIYNRASVSSPLLDRRMWNNTSLDSITLLAPVFSQSSKTYTDLNGGTVIPKDTLRYTIKVKNTGNYAAPNVVVTDSTPPGVVIVPGSITPGGSINGNVITFNTISSVAIGDSATLTYRVVIDSSIVGGLAASNIAHIKSLTVDQMVSSTFTPVNAPSMSLQKKTAAGTNRPGDTLTYTIVYSNNSTKGSSTGTQILDTLPSVLTYVAGSISNGGTWSTPPSPKGRIVWAIGTVAPGKTDSISFRAVIDKSTTGNTVITNTGQLTNSQGSTASSTRRDTVRFGATATLTATPSIAPGDTILMTLTDADLNKNSATIETYTFRDTSSTGEWETVTFTETGVNTGIFTGKMPTIFGLVAGTNNNGTFNAKAGDTIRISYRDTLRADGTSATITAKTGVHGGTTATLTATAAIFPRDTVFVTITDADLNRNAALAESYIVRDSNIATGEIENLTVTETGPNTGIFAGKIPTQFGLTAGTNNDGKFNVKAGDTLQVAYRDTLQANGSSAWIYARTAVKGGATATISAVPTLMAAGDSVTFTLTDADLNKRSGVADTVILTSTSSKGEIENLTYIETGVNTGVFRSGIKTTYGTGPGTNNNGVFTILPGDSIVATYHDSLTTTGDTANIKAVVKIGIVDFSLSNKKYLDKNGGLAVPQDSILYTVTVKNTGTVTSKSVSVVDTVPSYLTVVSGSITGGGTLAGKVITFTPFLLNSGDSSLLYYTVTIDTNAPDLSVLNNIARISGNGIIQLVNVSLSVSNRPSMSMTKTADRLTPLPGDTVSYTITYSNIGTGTATNVVIADTIPSHTSYVAQSVTLNGVSKTDQSDGDEVIVASGVVKVTLTINLKPGQGGIIRFKVKVN